MKIIAFLLVVSLPLFGTEPKVVSFDKLQHRGRLTYIPNQDTPFTGKAVSFHANGQKRQEATYKDGKHDGLWSWWYENGQKRGEVSWKDGKRDGLWTWWYESGQKERESNHKKGKLMSAEVWKPSGEKCPVTNVKDGDGVKVSYKEDGTVWRRYTVKNGKPYLSKTNPPPAQVE